MDHNENKCSARLNAIGKDFEALLYKHGIDKVRLSDGQGGTKEGYILGMSTEEGDEDTLLIGYSEDCPCCHGNE